MPPRTGPRRKKRVKQAPAAPRHFALSRADDDEPDAVSREVIAHSLELDAGHLVFRNHDGAISRIIAPGEWREINSFTEVTRGVVTDNRAVTSATVATAEPLPENREQATLASEGDLVIPPEHTLKQEMPEEDRRFVPASPEEAQRILRELHRRIAPDYQDPPDAAPPAPPARWRGRGRTALPARPLGLTPWPPAPASSKSSKP